MLAVRGNYKNGVIDLLEPIPGNIIEAELNIIVIPRKEEPGDDVFTEEDRAAYAEAVKDLKKGEYVDMEEYLKERGLRV